MGYRIRQMRQQCTDCSLLLHGDKSFLPGKFANMDGFMAGTIGKDAFQKKRGELAKQESRLTEQIALLEKQAQELKMEGSGETARAVEKIQSFSGAEALSADVVKALVKEVRITDREHMEIRWNFRDEVMEFIQG